MLADLDIPLMRGLTEDKEAGIVFDSPEGLIINAEAAGPIESKNVYEYYKVVLPSLSWRLVQRDRVCENGVLYCLDAVRGEESFLLQITSEKNQSIIRYSLSPN